MPKHSNFYTIMLLAFAGGNLLALNIAFSQESLSKDQLCIEQDQAIRSKNSTAYDAVYSSSLYRKCRRSTNLLLDYFMLPNEAGIFVPNSIIFDAAEGRSPFGLQQISDYSEDCLTNPLHVSGDRFQGFVLEVLNRLVIFDNKQDALPGPSCNGFMSNTGIITARHCLRRDGLSAVSTISFGDTTCKAEDLDRSNVEAFTFDGVNFVPLSLAGLKISGPDLYQNHQDKICKELQGPRYAKLRSAIAGADWVEIKMAQSVKLIDHYVNLQELMINAPSTNIEYLSLSTNKFRTIVTLVDDPKIDFVSLVEASLSIDTSPLCAPIAVKESSFVHGCQTQDISSGSPIIAYKTIFDRNGDVSILWSLFGINTGLAAYEATCQTTMPIGLVNDGFVSNGGVILKQ